MGIEPTYPSEKYGYIIPASAEETAFVKTFKEKPTVDVATEYIKQGALWNGGVFAYKLQYVLDKAHELIEFTDYYDLYEKYETLTKISFDYAVVEKEEKIQVMRFGGQWKDLGTWNTLTEAIEEQIVGKGILNDTCSGVHIINEMDVPVLAMGLTDVVISASAEGILVSDKEQSSYIKPFVDGIEQQVMFAEKAWGSYKVLDTQPDGPSVVASGMYKDRLLSDVLQEHPEFLGTHPREGFPILVKLIDASQDISIQVHPTDEYAMKYENGASGKTEMWYVLDAKPGAELIFGCNQDMEPAEMRAYLENGTIEKYLRKVTVAKDDVFYIPAGTIHAIGEGVLLAEIQQNSNLTYRLYDYERLDKD